MRLSRRRGKPYTHPPRKGPGEWCKLSSGVQGKALATKSYSALWLLQVSSPAVLLHKTLHNLLQTYHTIAGAKIRPRTVSCSIAGASATVAPAIPTPLDLAGYDVLMKSFIHCSSASRAAAAAAAVPSPSLAASR